MCRSDGLIGLSSTRTSPSPAAKGGVGISASFNTLFGSRKSFREFSDSVKTEGDDDLASTVNEPFAPVLIDFEESIGL